MVDQRRPGSHLALMCERLILFYKYCNSCLDNNFIADRKLCNWTDDMIQSSSMIPKRSISIPIRILIMNHCLGYFPQFKISSFIV